MYVGLQHTTKTASHRKKIVCIMEEKLKHHRAHSTASGIKLWKVFSLNIMTISLCTFPPSEQLSFIYN